jgi:hypothetical protein
MMICTAISDRLDRLYHWQRFDADRLWTCLLNRVIYCSDPATFNDPWDCKPHFNTGVLARGAFDGAVKAISMSSCQPVFAGRLHRAATPTG